MPAAKRSVPPGAVRIIGGEWRRRRIAVVDGLGLRPTPDRVRETLFNWLKPDLIGATCLDLFAGCGVLGLEALSRGAASAVFVERNREAANALRQQCLNLAADAEVIQGQAERFLARWKSAPFDIVFLDPPYALDAAPLLNAIRRVIEPGAIVYLERERGQDWPDHPEFQWTRRRAAGTVEFRLASFRGNGV